MKQIILIAPLVILSCRTLDHTAEHVKVLDKSPTGCENLGSVYADWAWWGVPSEILNVMRNQSAEKGGNAVWVQQPNVAFDYKCPANPPLL